MLDPRARERDASCRHRRREGARHSTSARCCTSASTPTRRRPRPDRAATSTGRTRTSRTDIKLVGIGEYNNAVVQDDVDARGLELRAVHARAHPPSRGVLRADDRPPGSSSTTAAATCPAVEAELERLNPLLGSHVYVAAVDEAKAERAIEPESIALGVFGLIAALATLLIAGQVDRPPAPRRCRRARRAARARRPARDDDASTGSSASLGAIVGGRAARDDRRGRALADRAASARCAACIPSRGIAFDWTVLGLGALALIVVLGAIAVVIAFRQAPHRVARRAAAGTPRADRDPRSARCGVATAGTGRDRRAVRARTRARAERGAGALGDPRRRARASSSS